MKRHLIIGAILLATGPGVAAQEVVEDVTVTSIDTEAYRPQSQAKSNWFVSVGAGPQVLFGDHDRQHKFKDRISPALDVAVGKWFNPVIGVRLMYSGLYAKGATQNGIYSTGTPIGGKPWTGYWLEESKFDFMNLHADLMVDLCNWWGSYNPDRVYSIAPYVGVGYAHIWSTPHNDAITGNLGIYNMFHVSRAIDINLDIRGIIMEDEFDGARGNIKLDGLLSVTVGVTYRFAPRGFNRAK